MSRYLQTKYVGTYRVLAEYNKATNDFPRIVGGSNDGALDPSFDDLYIPCASKARIMHVNGSILQTYIPSLGRGHNIIKAIYTDIIGDVTPLERDYETIYKQLTDNGIIFDIEDTDTEVFFKFKANNIEVIAKYLIPKTNGASISPFSTKNLPKTKYDIPVEDLALYKDLTASISQENIRMYIDLNNGFMNSLTTKSHTIDQIKTDMKLKMLKGKEYFHSVGCWNKYMDYLEKNIKLMQANFRSNGLEVTK